MMEDIVNRNDKGQLHGIQIGYYENSQISCEKNYINGNRYGEQIGYYENGQKIYNNYFINGESVSQEEWVLYERRSKLTIINDF
jgi:antitoxin component YwqK of YwqJK toxin-antitoxin module